MKPIFSLLNWLFAQIGNFGVAIICLTFIVRLLLFPIAQKQFASMAAMRVIQPKMKALQERYKDDKPRMQQEMMKLYKEEKVNPVAGCLPILLQIPIFYALYKVLMVVGRDAPPAVRAVDPGSLRARSADPGQPVRLPAVHAAGASSRSACCRSCSASRCGCSCKLNPQPTDPVQRQIFALMPWVLMFVDGAVRGRPAALLGDQQHPHHRPAEMALQPQPGDEGARADAAAAASARAGRARTKRPRAE